MNLAAAPISALPFAALADTTRQRIVEMLAEGALCSGDIAGRFALSAPAISQYLKTLKAARLVRVKAQAQKRIYELDPDGVAGLADWLSHIRSFWNPRLDAMEAALKREKIHERASLFKIRRAIRRESLQPR